MPRRRCADDNALPVMVPRYIRPLVPVAADRVRRLREHLVEALREARELKWVATSCAPQPSGFAARVAGTACGLCEGWCCRHGGNDAYLDGYTMARVRRDKPDLDAGALVRLYSNRVPAAAYEGSCIFHGSNGCTLDRSLRADICNSYFCGGLTAYLSDGDEDSPRIVLAGQGADMRSSAALLPSPPESARHGHADGEPGRAGEWRAAGGADDCAALAARTRRR
jgi:hypothetical protein